MENKGFLSGSEEAIARIVSLIISVVIFVAYTLGSKQIEDLNWFGVTLYLSGFWFLYEFLGYLFFLLFKYFGGKTTEKPSEKIIVEENLQNLEEKEKQDPSIDL